MSSQDSPESLAVSKVPLFKSLQYADLMSLLFFVEQKSFKKDENLFDKGDEPNGMYILMAGSLRVYVPPSQTGGAIKSLADLGPGKYVGEFGLIDELPRSASVLALEDCKVLIFADGSIQARHRRTPIYCDIRLSCFVRHDC
jgi:CRP-like cAMP-binding protein